MVGAVVVGGGAGVCELQFEGQAVGAFGEGVDGEVVDCGSRGGGAGADGRGGGGAYFT